MINEECDHPVDLADILAIAGENQQIVTTVTKHLITESPNLLAGMRNAINENDAGRLDQLAHKFRGMIISFKARRAHDLLLLLEQMGKKAELDTASDTLDKLVEEMDCIHDFLQDRFPCLEEQ